MKLAELRTQCAQLIGPLDADVLIGFVLQLSRAQILSRGEEEISEADTVRIEALVARRFNREPVAYIVGEKEFWGNTFLVSPAVLIPRPETEMLVERVLAATDGRHSEPCQIIDAGVGSGAILISIALELKKRLSEAQFSKCKFIGSDVSEDALRMCRKNVARHALTNHIELRRSDLLEGIPVCQPEIIVSNPPYIEDDAELPPDVEAYEPQLALRAGHDGMAVIERLIAQASPRIDAGSQLVFEIGAAQGDQVKSHVPASFAFSLEKDLAGMDRVVTVRKVK